MGRLDSLEYDAVAQPALRGEGHGRHLAVGATAATRGARSATACRARSSAPSATRPRTAAPCSRISGDADLRLRRLHRLRRLLQHRPRRHLDEGGRHPRRRARLRDRGRPDQPEQGLRRHVARPVPLHRRRQDLHEREAADRRVRGRRGAAGMPCQLRERGHRRGGPRRGRRRTRPCPAGTVIAGGRLARRQPSEPGRHDPVADNGIYRSATGAPGRSEARRRGLRRRRTASAAWSSATTIGPAAGPRLPVRDRPGRRRPSTASSTSSTRAAIRTRAAPARHGAERRLRLRRLRRDLDA